MLESTSTDVKGVVAVRDSKRKYWRFIYIPGYLRVHKNPENSKGFSCSDPDGTPSQVQTDWSAHHLEAEQF